MVTPTKPVAAPLARSSLTPSHRPTYHKHDSYSWDCWCKPVPDPEYPLLITHNDVPYPAN